MSVHRVGGRPPKQGFCQVDQRRQIVGDLLDTVLFSRRTSPAAILQMIDFLETDNWKLEGDVDPHERGYAPDCEPPEIAVPVRPT